MKMVARDANTQYLTDLKERLEQNGIPAMVQGENTARMIIPFSVFQPTLWIYIDEQLDDAIQLLANSNYQVKTGIDVDAFYHAQPNDNEQRSELNAALIHLGLVLGLVMVGMVAFIKLLD